MQLFIAIIVLGFVVFLLALPYLYKDAGYGVMFTDVPEHSRGNLKDEKASLILALKELDFDYETGKLSLQDYKELRDKYELRAVEVMKILEDVEKQWTKIQGEITVEVASRTSSVNK